MAVWLHCMASLACCRSNAAAATPSPHAPVPPQVRLIDQQQINEFGRINSRKHELNSDVKELRVRFDSGPSCLSCGCVASFVVGYLSVVAAVCLHVQVRLPCVGIVWGVQCAV